MGTITDFQAAGLAPERLAIKGRHGLISVDFEAFPVEAVPLWIQAVDRLSEQARRRGLRFSLFLSVEDFARLRAQSPRHYREMGQSLRGLHAAGSRFYVHNHYYFDPLTGERPEPSPGNDQPAPERYRKRHSMFFDVVHRHRLELRQWLVEVRGIYQSMMEEMACPPSKRTVFRAGGWDYGSSDVELKLYSDALAAAGFEIDSSACAGTFGTPTWHIGSDFGHNLFKLLGGSDEIAPTWSFDCGNGLLDARPLRALLSQRRLFFGGDGVFVVVLHFDHLFHRRSSKGYEYFAEPDPERIFSRLDRMTAYLSLMLRVLRLHNVTFDELPCLTSC